MNDVGLFDVDVRDVGSVEADVVGSQVDVHQRRLTWVRDGCGHVSPEWDRVGCGMALVDAVDSFDVRRDRRWRDRVDQDQEVDDDSGTF